MNTTIQLMGLTLKNFKGIKDFSLSVQGEDVKIYGDNATGKTTLFDAFIWLLFDKDSQNKKDFQLKTVSKSGDTLHGFDHEVSGAFRVNGNLLTLRKVFAEKWTKKRGSAEKHFSGHSTDYYIDEVPVKKKEYTDKVDSFVQEDIFKLLTSPSFFNEQLKWQDRRNILLTICGDVTDKEVIASNPALSKLPEILNGRKLEDHRKVIAGKRAEINKELDRIPVRIDEVQRSLPDISELSEEDLLQESQFLSSQAEAKEEEISRIKSGGEVSDKEKKLREVEGELLQIKNQFQGETIEKITHKRQELSQIKFDGESLHLQIKTKNNMIKNNEGAITRLLDLTDRLRKEWHEVNSQTFEAHHSTECPTCGQGLPEEQIQQAHEKALSRFNHEKATKLERIAAEGKKEAAHILELQETNKSLSAEISDIEEQIKTNASQVLQIQDEILDLQSSVKNVENDLTYIKKQKEALQLEEGISQLRSSVKEAAIKATQELAIIKNEIVSLKDDLNKFAQVKVADKRIAELKDQERMLAREYEKLEQELYLTEEFIRSKVTLLEEKINSKFKYARFKLFETQINGGITEICETLFDGVPYSGGLNNAARINVGLDIINTLSDHYGVLAPIFVDNSEAVTSLIDVNSQVISLVVSEADKQLRVEYANKFSKEAI